MLVTNFKSTAKLAFNFNVRLRIQPRRNLSGSAGPGIKRVRNPDQDKIRERNKTALKIFDAKEVSISDIYKYLKTYGDDLSVHNIATIFNRAANKTAE